MNLLIGSRALALQDRIFKLRPDADWDVISSKQLEGCEQHDPEFLLNRKLEKYITGLFCTLPNGETAAVVSMKGLCLIKRSHLWRDLSFDKHITHYHKHLAKYRQTFDELDEQLLDARYAATQREFPQGNPNLNQDVKSFFEDAVEKKFDHDWLHELFAYYDKPLYTRLQTDKTKAWCDKDLWKSLSHRDKVKCVAEEVQVISTERFLVPSNWKEGSKLAYMKSLRKVCTTLCSGWFRDFAIDNYPEIVLEYDKRRFDKVKSVLESGSVKFFNK